MISYRRFRAGLSLIEVLISALLLAILTLILVGVMQITLQYWRKTNTHVQAERNAQAIMAALCNDFRQCSSTSAGGGLNTPAVGATIDTAGSAPAVNGTPFLEFTIVDPSKMTMLNLAGSSASNPFPCQSGNYEQVDYYMFKVNNPSANNGGQAYGVYRVVGGGAFSVSTTTFANPGPGAAIIAATETGALEVVATGLAGGSTGTGSTPPKVHFHVLASEYPNDASKTQAANGTITIANGAAYTYELDSDQTAYSI
ncbi:MAG TPA: hypothetical protein VGO93_17510 [Candidatus Xenobia bacterium]|jgi:type II secretory pathway pseudopilin PulG